MESGPPAVPGPSANGATVWSLEHHAGGAGRGELGAGLRAEAHPGAAPGAAAKGPKQVKYQEAVRGAKRADLGAYECPQCRKFYSALDGGLSSHVCRHAAGLGAQPGAQPGAEAAEQREAFRNLGGRHRAQWAPPATPEGLWNLSFS